MCSRCIGASFVVVLRPLVSFGTSFVLIAPFAVASAARCAPSQVQPSPHKAASQVLTSPFLIQMTILRITVTRCRSALDRLHDNAVHSDVCFVCGNSLDASPVNCNVHAFSAGEGGRGAGAFVMMNSSMKHDNVQAML